ncbi:CocE/NonD family hydrolase [Jiangella alkaliphila]|uniref:Xaa-Pro dipeptidyl-peptidase C-terminal domain-containing protein n=1 Tax=Jiangella alkaliphila TaxID=419479 RepID=A0A1H2L7X2_9ACTN|nr:CocE/NonD family hydrolase [Jiangella alkaliphila]SDU76902.1 hypothetical protein SAMN04488563_5353 [Jiangella alkaliphila]
MTRDVVVERDVLVPMRDGTRLAADVYRPTATPGPGPVLLHRTPYDKTEPADGSGWARMFAEHGYVAVVQDCRGCHASEGEVDFLFPEAEDGQDTVEWIRRQPWCDGRVGTWGASWSGWAQTAMAALGTPGLAAMVPVTSGSDGGTSAVRHGGAVELRWVAWAFSHAARNVPAAASGPGFGDWLARWPIRPGGTQLAAAPAYERWAFHLLTADDDDPAWRHPSLAPLAHLDTFTDAPTLLIGGWYDSYARGTLELYERLAAGRRGPIRVVMGPWAHGGLEEPHAGDVWFGDDAVLDPRAVHRRWFDRWLQGERNGVDDEAPVRLFVMGGGSGVRRPDGRLSHGGRWRDETEWPLARATPATLHLHAGGRLAPDRPADAGSATTYRFDPSDPVPTIGGNVSALTEVVPGKDDARDIVSAGGFDQREGPHVFGASPPYSPLADRPDVLVFQSGALPEPVEVTGTVEVHLWVSSTAVSTDVTAKLIDLHPPSAAYPHGYALNLTDSIIRVRDTRSAAPDPADVTIMLYPTSNLFRAGHRIRVDISSSNFPRFDVNPNTGEPPGRSQRHVVAVNTIHHDNAHPSRIVLPIVPPPTARCSHGSAASVRNELQRRT